MRDLMNTIAMNERAALAEGAGPAKVVEVPCEGGCGRPIRTGAEPYYTAGLPLRYYHPACNQKRS